MKSYDHLNFSRASVVQLQASLYIMRLNLIMDKIHNMSREVENALETANYDKLLQSGLQVRFGTLCLFIDEVPLVHSIL